MAGESTVELCGLGVSELGQLYRSRELSPVEVTSATLDRIQRLDPQLNSYIAVLTERALAAAKAAELQLGAGIDLGPMHGIPVSVKDIIRAEGTRTTAASRVLGDAPPDTEDAIVVARLHAAGAVLLGKANLYEFAFGYPDPDSPFGIVQNPRRLGHQAGGSSSGSGAAVAAGLGPLSLGTDTGGSVRHPASLCGVVGLKPTNGLVSLRGVIPLSAQLDQVGPLGRSVADVAACFHAIAGHDPGDPSSLPTSPRNPPKSIRGLRLGVPINPCFGLGFPSVLAAQERAKGCLADDVGLTPIPISVPLAEETDAMWEAIAPVDLWAFHGALADKEELYGNHFRSRARSGMEISAVVYARALAQKAEMRRKWLAMFEQIDVLYLPGNVAGAPPIGAETVRLGGADLPVRMVCSPHNRAANLTGFPSLTLPVGEDGQGLPVAVQLLAPPLCEARLLAIGQVLEEALGNLVAGWGIEPKTAASIMADARPSSP